jgi:hypothetical protein
MSQFSPDSGKASASRPGKSDQGTGTQRLLACVMTGGKGPRSTVGALDAGLVTDDRGGSGSSSTGATEQAARLPTIVAINPLEAVRRKPQNGNLFMTLILLEALLALLLFVVIVWWTMFSGRKNGELPPTDEADAGDSKEKMK